MTDSAVNFSSKMASEPEIFDTSETVELRHGYYMMFSSMLFFQLLNYMVCKIGTPKSVSEDPWRWRNLFISWIHAFMCGTWDVLCFVLYPELLDDPILYMNYFTYLMVPFATGYFVYDTIDMLINKKLFSNWEVTLHHIAVTSMFWYNFHGRMCIGYNCLALMAEINSFFLHSRKLLQMSKYSYDHWFYKSITLINLCTFSTCRGYSISRIIYGMVTESHRVGFVYFVTLSMSMFVMTVINFVLFWRLLKSDLLRQRKTRKVRVEEKANGNHNYNHVKAN